MSPPTSRKSPEASHSSSPTSPTVISSAAELESSVSNLLNKPANPLFMLLSGPELAKGRSGSIATVQILDSSTNRTLIIDTLSIGRQAFKPETLGGLFDSAELTKVLFDVRPLTDILYHTYGIVSRLVQLSMKQCYTKSNPLSQWIRNAIDVHIMEHAMRPGRRPNERGWSECLELDAGLSAKERAHLRLPGAGSKLIPPIEQCDTERPLSKEVVRRCSMELELLERLFGRYSEKLSKSQKGWHGKMLVETERRVSLCKKQTW